MKNSNSIIHVDGNSMIDSLDTLVAETDVVLDLGCGIVPMNYFRPKLHIMVEPWKEYCDVLRHRHADDKSVIVLKLDALSALAALHDNSVDSVFLLDVIEHLEKSAGLRVISEIERVTRQQAVVFTPLGFMRQKMHPGEMDAWGLSGGDMQKHKSGWFPKDFGPQWKFHVCETYHQKDFRGNSLEKPVGAFFAIFNFTYAPQGQQQNVPDIRRPLPSEIKLEKLQVKLSNLEEKLQLLESDNYCLKLDLEAAIDKLAKMKGDCGR